MATFKTSSINLEALKQLEKQGIVKDVTPNGPIVYFKADKEDEKQLPFVSRQIYGRRV